MKEYKIQPMTPEEAKGELGDVTKALISELSDKMHPKNSQHSSEIITKSSVHALAYIAAAQLVSTALADMDFFNKNPINSYDERVVDFVALVTTYAVRMFETEVMMRTPPTGATN